MKYRKLLNLLAVISLAVGLFTGFLAPKSSQARPATPDRNLAVSETGYYIVRLEDASVTAYNGGIRGLAATSTEATGTNRLDPNTPASKAYYNYLENKQQGLLDAMRTAFGHEIEVAHQYLYVLNAVAMRLTHEEALSAFDLPGVLTVYADTISYPDTDVGPQLIGADAVWNGDTYSELATLGEGIVIGVIDTGINPTHPSFDETGPVDGYVHTNPYGKDVFHGWCETVSGFCNDKLIGAYKLVDDGVFPPDTPEDVEGHGSHTASTAGGNVQNAYFDVNGLPFSRTISGVAPHANIVAYRVCLPNAGCSGIATIMAVDLAIGTDMVDVINYSIGPGGNPWLDPVELAFLEATDAGIFVSVSAGNSGPGVYGWTPRTMDLGRGSINPWARLPESG
jgi:subtilisin family serine protease